MPIARNTKSLKAVKEVFETCPDAHSAVELVTQFREIMNKTTVYRILDRLEAERVIHSFTDGNGLTWYAKCKECDNGQHHDVHPHFQCTDCGRTECLSIEFPIPKLPDHQIEHVQLLFTGKCGNCTS